MKSKKFRLNMVTVVSFVAICFLLLIVVSIIFKRDDNVKEPNSKETTASIESSYSQETDVSEPTNAAPESKPETQSKAEPKKISVESLTLNKYEVTLSEGNRDMPLVTIHPENATDKSEIWQCDNTDIASVDDYGNILAKSAGNCVVTVRSTDNPKAYAKVKVTVKKHKAQKKVKATYINGILIANKTYALPSDYNPDVDATANSALQKMFSAAKKDGLNLFVVSGFRSYDTQKYLYDSYVARDGKEEADRYSARPGHSEHQTGLAFDINSDSSSFEGTPEAKWLAKNCHKYGFIIRYPKGKEAITGYIYEPWHIRYLGKETAQSVYNSGLTLEEYLGITSVYS